MVLPTLFALAIPADLAPDLQEMAKGSGVTPEALALSVLRAHVRAWKHEPQPLEPALTKPLVPRDVLERLMTESIDEAAEQLPNRTLPASILEALETLGAADAFEIAKATGHPLDVFLRRTLARMATDGRVVRVRHGVYALPTAGDQR